MSVAPVYPVRVEGKLDPEVSRWLWLVKWLLAIPHYVVLFFLWVAFVVLSTVAFVAIVFTERYPRSLFDFNVGVLRWSWRVAFYSYSALGTDRYPPFTLGPAPDYPATLEIQYPERLSRSLALVKWWLLAIPHYLVVAFFVGGIGFLVWKWPWGGGLIGLLVLIAAVALLFTGRYPRGIFDFVLGLDRWALRVAAYAALMTDVYPPFRLDLGGHDPGTVQVAAPPAAGSSFPAAAAGWSAGRVAMVVLGSLAVVVSVGLLAGGGALTAVDRTQRDRDGFLMTPAEGFRTTTYALVSEPFVLRPEVPDWLLARDLLGTVRVRSESDHPVFVGIARTDEVSAYLGGVRREEVQDLRDRHRYRLLDGGAPAGPPGAQPFWAAATEGSGTQTLSWDVADGRWSVVLMSADGSRPVDAQLSVGSRLASLLWVGIGLLVAGALLLLAAAALVYAGVKEPRARTG